MRFAVLLLLLLSPAACGGAGGIEGRVVAVSDGDTLTVLTAADEEVKVRLAGIDTPEARQPYGARARQQLADLAFRRPVRVEVEDIDHYGRTVGRVHAGGRDVNAEMVRLGGGWVYRQYSRDRALLDLEQEAREARRGLWSLPEAERVPPWAWRQADRDGSGPATPRPDATPAILARQDPSGGQSLACGSKRTCGQMAGCEEARFHLAQCGLSRLDIDGDGVPCEALCR